MHPMVRTPRPRHRAPWRSALARSGVGRALLGAALLASAGCAGGGVREDPGPRGSRIESDPPGALVYVDEQFTGRTPVTVFLPARPRVRLRVEHPGHAPSEQELRRAPVGDDAPEGAGWEALYYVPLEPTGP